MTASKDKWKDDYNWDISSGQAFLKSDAGRIYLECVWSGFKENYEGSD